MLAAHEKESDAMKPWYHRERNRDLQPHELNAWRAAVREWRGKQVNIATVTVTGVKRFSRYTAPAHRDVLWGLYIKHLLLRSKE